MSDYVEVFAIVEGQTEMKFVKEILAPYIGVKNVGMTAIVASKPGQKGGDIRFERLKDDIGKLLKQRKDTYITMLIDFYGITDWPDYDVARKQSTHLAKAKKFLATTKDKVQELFAAHDSERRFIPYVSMYEFEALLFSTPDILASHLGIRTEKIQAILTEFGEPENINDSPHTAPSKRLETLRQDYGKTSTGIAIAKAIGIDAMRKKCPLFDDWLIRIEALPALQSGGDHCR